MWYEMTLQYETKSPGFCADVHITAASPWFEGHFPGEPVLPGIAQLSMVVDLIQRCSNPAVGLKAMSRVRFKKLIRPDDRIRIEAVPKAGNSGVYSFRILKDAQLVSSGNLTLGKSAEDRSATNIEESTADI